MLAKLAYRPFAIVVGALAWKVSGKALERAWENSQGTKPPNATTEEATWGQVVGAAALHAGAFAVTNAVADRVVAKGFRHVTGFWPGDKQPKPLKKIKARPS